MSKPRITKAYQKAMARRPKLVKEREYAAPEYSDIIKKVSEARDAGKSAQSVFEHIKDNKLRAYLLAHRNSVNELQEWAYNWVKANPEEFDELVNELFHKYPNKAIALQHYMCWSGYTDEHHLMKLEAEVAKYFGTYSTRIFRSIFAVSNMLRSDEFLSKICEKCNAVMPSKNTTTYEEVKKLLHSYNRESTRYILTSEAKSEKERIMLLLFRKHVAQFTQSEYDRLVKGDNARTAINFELEYLLRDKSERAAVKEYLGIECEPKASMKEVVKNYNFSATTLKRRVDFVMENFEPQLHIR